MTYGVPEQLAIIYPKLNISAISLLDLAAAVYVLSRVKMQSSGRYLVSIDYVWSW